MSQDRAADLTALLAVLLAGVVLVLTLPAVKPALDADEGVYLSYARELAARARRRCRTFTPASPVTGHSGSLHRRPAAAT